MTEPEAALDYAEYAAVAAQIVPVLLLAAVAVPLRLDRGRADRPRALLDLVLTGLLVGAAGLTETVALFGVFRGRLLVSDARLLTGLLFLVAGLATVRVLAPLARQYADDTGVPESRVWAWLIGLLLLSFRRSGVPAGVTTRPSRSAEVLPDRVEARPDRARDRPGRPDERAEVELGHRLDPPARARPAALRPRARPALAAERAGRVRGQIRVVSARSAGAADRVGVTVAEQT